MTRVKRLTAGLATAAAALALAAPANADVDSDFSAQLKTYGIYGQKDLYAWMAKITCKRLRTGLDPDAAAAVTFLNRNLTQIDEPQAWQLLGATITYYCPDQTPVWEAAAAQHNS
ncbi:DUF732 domain-containing protein [Mycobacterium sp. MYCO198283]|uniref:DUF732 domain-containing protein n=1 Tax=Mycobacterium sp. MYCO198283 TaxID=2883505 RepID=UPI001E370E9B|nr:DUF732 domain-containing protein [Mycobacterium sp. MYCO198283]MCG5434012.1 DUF732 domain-containing protein [Mycobacterium sp. MYCO198283]